MFRKSVVVGLLGASAFALISHAQNEFDPDRSGYRPLNVSNRPEGTDLLANKTCVRSVWSEKGRMQFVPVAVMILIMLVAPLRERILAQGYDVDDSTPPVPVVANPPPMVMYAPCQVIFNYDKQARAPHITAVDPRIGYYFSFRMAPIGDSVISIVIRVVFSVEESGTFQSPPDFHSKDFIVQFTNNFNADTATYRFRVKPDSSFEVKGLRSKSFVKLKTPEPLPGIVLCHMIGFDEQTYELLVDTLSSLAKPVLLKEGYYQYFGEKIRRVSLKSGQHRNLTLRGYVIPFQLTEDTPQNRRQIEETAHRISTVRSSN